MASTTAQQMAVAIAPKFTAAASAVSSALTLVLVARETERRAYHRLVGGMSACDLAASVAWFCTTWPIPRGTAGVYGAMGTQATCSAQAFFAQFSLSTVMYNASLAVYYALVIVEGWKDGEIARIEPVLHVNAVAWGLGTGLASLGLTLFNQVGWDCWISAAPLGCQESWNSPDGTTTCTRGDNGSLYQWAFYYAPLWLVILLVSFLMARVYWHVRTTEKKMARYSVGNLRANASERLSNSKRIAAQAAFYVGGFFLTWLFPTVFQLVIVTTNAFPFPLLLLTAFFVPIQGVFILMVYIRPKYVKFREDNPGRFFVADWFRVLRKELDRGGVNRPPSGQTQAIGAGELGGGELGAPP